MPTNEHSEPIKALEILIQQGILTLSECLHHEWPQYAHQEKNEIPEANLTIHISHSFLSQDYCVYPEYPTDNKGRYDLVLFHPRQSEYVIVECKRFLKFNKKNNINIDFERMLEQKMLKPSIGILITMTRYKEISDWWVNYNRNPKPKRKSSKNWEDLSTMLKETRAIVGHVPLTTKKDNTSDYFHEALYAIFKIP